MIAPRVAIGRGEAIGRLGEGAESVAERIPLDLDKVRDNLDRIQQEIAEHYQIARHRQVAEGRISGTGVQGPAQTPPRIVLVSKYLSPADTRVLRNADIGPLGENRADDLCDKADAGADPRGWHFIGHLQRNKASRVISRVEMIHALESPHLAATIERLATERGAPVACLVQVNTSGEEAKGGLDPAAAVSQIVQWSRELRHVHLRGLMTMAPLAPREECRPVFRRLRELRDEIRGVLEPDPAARFQELSMGMSNDYPVAVEEGATILRLGRCLLK